MKKCDPKDPNDIAFNLVSALIFILLILVRAILCFFCDNTAQHSFIPIIVVLVPLPHQATKYKVPAQEAMSIAGTTVTL